MYKIIIIGAGPAGMAAAIQLKRYGLNPLLIEKHIPGGLLHNANLVENYLGFPSGISGNKLTELFTKQLQNNYIDILNEEAEFVDYKNNLFEIKTTSKTLQCNHLLIATGTTPKKPDFIKDFNNVFYEITSIANIYDKKIAIIGAGDAAFDYAINLSKNNQITILNRSKNIKCIETLLNQCKKEKNINYIENIQVTSTAKCENKLILQCNHESIQEIITDYLLIAIGRNPNLIFLSDKIKNNLTNLKEQKLIYFIGDVKNQTYRQTAISTGDGIKAAMEIFDRINQEKQT